MNRRGFLNAAAGLSATAALPSASALTLCGMSPTGRACRSEIDFAQFQQFAYQRQASSQWCWAACISMVFAFHGHPVAQPRIVAEAYGGLVNWPAPGMVIARSLQRAWVDDDGTPFRVRIDGLYDAQFGVLATDNGRIARALDGNRPLIIGARGHALVLTALEYQTAPGPFIPRMAGVFDPWPGRGARVLAPDEMTPMHLGGSLQFIAGIDVA